MSRRLAVLAAALVACSVLAPAAFATGASASEHEIDSCTVIDEPGEYELVTDVQHDGADHCLEIRADNVTIDGNGHALEGPGAETDARGIDLASDSYNDDLAVEDVEISGWSAGIYAGGNYELSNAVLRENDDALRHDHGGADQLTDVTIENNGIGIQSIVGGAVGTNVTIQDNRQGVYGEDGGTYAFDDSHIADNEEEGLQVGHHTDLELTDSTVSGNGDHGIAKIHSIGEAGLHVENSTVANNGGDGIIVIGPNTVQLTDVTVTGNDGLEVNANVDGFSPPISASNLHVGPSATASFENETVAMEPVDAEDLPARDDGTAVGDGLNVSGNVSGPVDLELDVSTDDETVDLWRHDGSDWETVDENLSVTDGSIGATVEEGGVYAPGTDDEQNDTDDEEDQQDGEDDSEDDTQDDTKDDSRDGDDSGDDSEPSDQDGEKKDKHTETPTDSDGSSCGCSGSSGSSDGQETTDSPTPTPANESTPEDDEQQQVDEDADGDAGDDESNDDDSTLGDGPGFTGVAALVALLASALLLHRRQ